MRATDWIDLPGFTNADGGLNTASQSTGATIGFSAGDMPGGFRGIAKDVLNAGGSFDRHRWLAPCCWNDWDGDVPAAPSPPVTLSFPAGGGGGNIVGKSSRGSDPGLFQLWTVEYYLSVCWGTMSVGVDLSSLTTLGNTLVGGTPPGDGDTKYSFIEWKHNIAGTVLPVPTGTLTFTGSADATRLSGSLSIYGKASSTVPDPIPYVGAPPGWDLIGSTSYSAAGINPASITFPAGYAPGQTLYVAVRANDDWIDPPEFTTPDEVWNSKASWESTTLSVDYPDGFLSYRWVGPEIIEGGAAQTDGIYFGVIEDPTAKMVTVKATSPPTILDSVTWPHNSGSMSYGSLRAVARPDGRSGSAVTLLDSDGGWNLHRVTVAAGGTMSVQTAAVDTGQLFIFSAAPTMFGCNETSRVLVSRWTGSAYYYRLYDTATGTSVWVTGIYPSAGTSEWTEAVSFSQGATYLLNHHVDNAGGWSMSRFQRYTISPTGTATPVGPLMTIPQLDSAARPSDYYDDPGPGDVWDDGNYVAVGLQVWRASTQTSELMLAIFDGMSTAPRHFLTLTEDPSGNQWQSDPTTVTFSKVGAGYVVSYLRSCKRPVEGSSQSLWWSTYVTRAVDPVSGALGPEIFVSDTDWDGGFDNPGQLMRADNGVSLGWLERYPYESGTKPSKIHLIAAQPGAQGEGGHTLVDWRGMTGYPSGTVWAHTWVGLQESGIPAVPGRLYFKHRWA